MAHTIVLVIKTTFRLPDEVITELKHIAIDEQKTLTELVTQVLTDYLNKKRSGRKIK